MVTINQVTQKIIFIDVDGPLAWGTWGDGRVNLNSGSELFTIPYPWVEDDCSALRNIIDTTDAKLVLSSDWRMHYGLIQMKRIFQYYGIPGHHLIDTTTHMDLWKKLSRPPLEWERAAQIAKWVKDNKIRHWIAIDDLDIGNQFKWLKPRIPSWRHVQVDGDHGHGGRLRDKIDECVEKLNK
jgi:hypothetical protein